MKDHLDLSKLTFFQAIDQLYGPQLEDVVRVVQVLQSFTKMLPGMRVNTFYQQAVKQNRFKYRDFKFIVSILYDMDRIQDIYRQCKDYR